VTDPAAGTLAHSKWHYIDRVDPASPEALVALVVLAAAMLGALWIASRRATGRRRRLRSSST
jgi:hypothetical protein